MLTIALSKGRILDQTLPLLEKAGISIPNSELESRKLILNTKFDDIKVIVLRASDVPVFVQHGAADFGIAGKDVLMEHGADGVFELLDLGISKCRLMIASKKDKNLNKSTLKVATKYIRSTKEYFYKKGKQIEVIKLSGAMELAPIVGLSDCIVDLVDTGKTLKANNLVALELIHEISSRLIVNSAAFNTKHSEINDWITKIKKSL